MIAVTSTGSVVHEDGAREYLFSEPAVITAAERLKNGDIITMDASGALTLHASGRSNEAVAEIPEAIGAFAIVSSPSGDLAAIIGSGATYIMDIKSHRRISVIYPLLSVDLTVMSLFTINGILHLI
ncbi:MAG: hypothetical protein LBU32_16025 [Clostridiales bacterium]|nr:hypothetical protein [Clostridiales bacterium]